MWTAELGRWLDRVAREAGFDAAGVAEVRSPDEPAAAQEAARFAAWVESGHAGEMEYLKRRDQAGTLVRSALQVAMPWARSVVVCAYNYQADAPMSIDPAPPGAGWIARYAWSGRTLGDGTTVPTDYHELLGRLRAIESGLLAQAECTTRCYVDTGPLVERSVAAQAGVGWIGKNTCVLNQQLGSWLLLGVIVTSLPIPMSEEVAALVAPDRCGTCTRCIDACPTGALLGSSSPESPREMDASLCIAYLTIEKKGAIDESLQAEMGRQVFGCDICQEVCPWNRKAHALVSSGREGMTLRSELINPALERTGRKRLLRNVAIAMGNSGDKRFLPQLDTWADGGSAETQASPNDRNANDSALSQAAAVARARILRISIPD
jgi:epoxyqueuosine reductase